VLPGADLVECFLQRCDIAWGQCHLTYVHSLKINHVWYQDLLVIKYALDVMCKHDLTDIAKVGIDIL
jgi:hypothetical protein